MGVFWRQEEYTGEDRHGSSEWKAAESLETDLIFHPVMIVGGLVSSGGGSSLPTAQCGDVG